MDYRKFKAPYLRRAQIWEKADALRARFPSCAKLPVPVLDLAEFDLGLELVPKARLRQAGDIESLLLGDLKTIFVDRDAFLDPRSENRLRFSVAHEIGHLILHADVYGGLRHESLEAWMEFLLAIPEAEYDWLESHAYEFAGRLLVPPEPLQTALTEAVQTAEQAGFTEWDATGETALSFVANHIRRQFGVSTEVIAKRLRAEKLWPPKNS
ncbi:MAG TPA: ImmA/IrrE family metallo-endopeptidase [Verrucomicrobiae bacterium]|nr:ImmA/IrrE family metallo-endopeptidase [Verrucomicrobiae bacterium]